MCRKLAAFAIVAMVPFAVPAAEESKPEDLASWVKEPATFTGVTIADGKTTLTSDPWAFLLHKDEHADGELGATVTILEPAKRFDFFGAGWSAWPNPTVPDGGFEVSLLLRAGRHPVTAPPGITCHDSEPNGYRVQLSHKYQEIALVKYPYGGYVQSVPCEIKLKQPHRVAAKLEGNRLTILVDGVEKIRYQDDVLPLAKGRLGVGVSSNAKVVVEDVRVISKPAGAKAAAKAKHVPKLAVRKWLGGRNWVFDGNEPILQLPYQQPHSKTYFTQTVDNVKLLPGYKAMLNWNGHWDVANQGAFADAASKGTDAEVTGGGETLTASWTGKQHEGRFTTHTKLTIGFDSKRGTYTYDVDTEMDVLAEFHFRYGYDFEHHQPLDPFRWQYVVLRGEGGNLFRRPVNPVDPGPQNGVYQKNGLRLWYGRHLDQMLVAPAVEYDIPEPGKRKLNTAVCAAFYDTGVAFEAETAKPGTKIHVKYRYTGYPAAEAEALFNNSTIYPSFMLDPRHHYIFAAGQWPKLTFNNFAPMSETWIYGRTPFMTGHNQRPTYELAKDTGFGSGFAMKLGPGAHGAAALPIPAPLPAGRWLLQGQCRSDNAHGTGGRIQLNLTQAKTNKVLKQETHYAGNGSFNWKPIGFAFEVPADVGGLSIEFGNAGTGDVYFAEVEFKQLAEGAGVPDGVSARANATPPKVDAAPAGALIDYRMAEQKGLHVLNHAVGPFGMLELANAEWVIDEGRPALRLADNASGRKDYPRAGTIERGYFSHHAYASRQTVPVAIAGLHGGGYELKAFTIAAFIKPAAQMGKSDHGGKGDVVGLGARRVILRLNGQQAPYQLSACLNVNDSFTAPDKIEAGRWAHVALTGTPAENKKWRVRLYLDGKLVQEGVTKVLDAPLSIPPSLILGAELFYLHDSYYRGLIGHTLVFDQALSGDRIAELAAEGKK